jgi:hypothetical protein
LYITAFLDETPEDNLKAKTVFRGLAYFSEVFILRTFRARGLPNRCGQ